MLCDAEAELMAEAFVFNMDSLVTRDYLEACLDARFSAQGARIDSRFAAQDARIDARFTEQDKRVEKLSAKVDVKFAEIDGKFRLIYWMLAVIIASTTVPALHTLLTG
jgi:hypothetical protein